MAARKLPVAITEEEFTKLIKNTYKVHHRIAFLFGFGSGLRISEITNLEQRDIHIKDKKVDVRQGKGSKDRVVPLPKGFKEANLKHIPIKCGVRSLQRSFKMAAKRAGLLETKPTIHFHCVSEDTEILTLNGWKRYKQLKRGERIFSYNIKKQTIEKDNIIKINKYNHSGEMVNIKNTYLDCLMSRNHNDLMNIVHIKIINKKRVSSVWDGWKLLEIEKFLEMKNKRLVKKRVSGKYDGEVSIGKAKAGILGWILTDGCIHKRKNRNYEIVITQSYDRNRNKCEIIKELLINAKIEHTIKIQKPNKNRFNPNARMVVFRLSSKGKNLDWIFDFLTPNKKPKFNLLNLKKEELEKMFLMLMLGDGCYNGEFCCQDKEIVEFLQILCILINKRCLISKGTHNITNKEKLRTWITNYNNVNVLPSHISKIDYNGIVWCPTTKNKTWIARRNKKVFITGNSLRHGFATRLVKQGVPIHHIRTMLGHSNISTTNIYLEANPLDALKSYEEHF